jgi:hypothetical protein
MSSDTNLVFDPTGRADLPQHRHGLLWHGPRLPRPRRKGAQVGSGILEDLRRVPEHEGHGRRDCDGHARCDTVWVSRFGRGLVSMEIASPHTVEASRLPCAKPMLTIVLSGGQWCPAIRCLAPRRRLRQRAGSHPLSGRPVRFLLGMEGQRDRQEPSQRKDVPREAVSRFRALIARDSPSVWTRRLVSRTACPELVGAYPDVALFSAGITTTFRSKTRSTRRS